MTGSDRPLPMQEARAGGTATAVQRRDALRVVVFMLGAAVAYAFLLLYFAVRSGAWQLFVQVGVVLALAAVAAGSVVLIRRGRVRLGVRLVVVGLLAAVLVSMLLVKGLGILGGLVAIVLVSMITGQTLSLRETGWMVIAGVAVGVAALVVDLYGPAYRLSVPATLRFSLQATVVVLVVVYGFFAVRRLLNYNLRTKMIVAFLVVVLVSLSLLAYLNDRATRAALTEEANRALFATASQTAFGIDSFVRSALGDLRTESQLPVLVDYLGLPEDERRGSAEESAVAATLSSLSTKDVVNIVSYALLDDSGRNVVDTVVSNVGQDESSADYYRLPLQTGLFYASPVLVEGGRGVLYFSSPVRDARGDLVGVLRLRYNATVLQGLVAQATGLAGEGSYGALFDENHVYLAHGMASGLIFKLVAPLEPGEVEELQASGRLPDLPTEELLLDVPDLEKGLAGAEVQPYFTADLTELGGGLQSAALATLETQPWSVVFFQPQEVFLEPAVEQTRATAVLAVMIAVVTSVVAVGVAQLLAGPITRLTAVAREVAAGNLTVRARAETGDEIGVLATTFNSMTEQLRRTLEGLEQRVADRTRGLQTAAEVSRAATSLLDPDELLRRTVELVRERFDLYYVGLFLLDEKGEFAVLRAGTGEAGRRMLEDGHRLKVGGESMIGQCVATARARIALDVGEEAVRFDNPLLPETRSEIALPLRSRGQVVGAMSVQSVREAAFDETDVAVMQTMADQVAVAIDNARLFADVQEALEAERRSYGELSAEAWRRFLAAQPVGFVRDRRGVSPIGDLWHPQMKAALQTGETVVGQDDAASVATPIKVRGRVIGVIDAHRADSDGGWTPEQVALLETLADQLGVALESARLYQDAQRRAVREQLLGEVTARIRETLDLDTVLKTAVQETRQALGVPEVVVRLVPRPAGEDGDDAG